MKAMRIALVLLVGALATAVAADTNTATGTWQWKFTMPDGTETNPKLRLKQDGSVLSGTSVVRGGTDTAVTNGVVDGDSVRFEVVRYRNGVAALTRYSGRRDGNVIRGKVESNWAGETRTYEWEARRAAGIEGTWKWTTLFRDRPFESRATLKLEGDQLTGSMPGFRGGRPTPIKNATFKDGEVSFEVERGRDDFRSISKFEGKLEGDKITGVIETTFGSGEPVEADWDAERVD